MGNSQSSSDSGLDSLPGRGRLAAHLRLPGVTEGGRKSRATQPTVVKADPNDYQTILVMFLR